MVPSQDAADLEHEIGELRVLHRLDHARARQVDAILMGAVGGPKWDKLEFNLRPERGNLTRESTIDLSKDKLSFEDIILSRDLGSLQRC